jgi:hypothetical protein
MDNEKYGNLHSFSMQVLSVLPETAPCRILRDFTFFSQTHQKGDTISH